MGRKSGLELYSRLECTVVSVGGESLKKDAFWDDRGAFWLYSKPHQTLIKLYFEWESSIMNLSYVSFGGAGQDISILHYTSTHYSELPRIENQTEQLVWWKKAFSSSQNVRMNMKTNNYSRTLDIGITGQ